MIATSRMVLVTVLIVLALESHAEDFMGTLSRAYAANPDLQIGRSQLSAADEGVPLALAARRPSVGGFVSRGKAGFDQWPFSPVNKPSALRSFRYTPHSAGINVSQPLYSGGALDAQLAGAEAQVLATRATLQQTEQQVLLAAANAYLDLWLAERKVVIQRNNEKDLTQQLAANQRQFQRRDITVTDLGQTETKLAQAISERIQDESALADARQAYRVVVGADPGAVAGLPELKGLPPGLDAVLARAAAANPAITAANHTKNVAEEGIDLQKSGWKPSASLSYQKFNSTGVAAGTPRLNQEEVLLNLSLPIYRGGAVGSHIRTAREQATKADTAIEETRRGIAQAAVSAWYSAQAAADAVASYKVQVSAAELALQGVDLGAAHGTRSILDKLNARQELRNARLALEQAEHDRVLTNLQLLSAMGELNARQLGLSVELHDPLPHYEQSRASWSDQGWQR